MFLTPAIFLLSLSCANLIIHIASIEDIPFTLIQDHIGHSSQLNEGMDPIHKHLPPRTKNMKPHKMNVPPHHWVVQYISKSCTLVNKTTVFL